MKRRTFVKGAAAVLAATVVAGACFATGCGSDNAPDGNVFRMGSTAYIYNETLDPAYNWDGWELEYYGVCENLLKLTDDFQTEPWLAESVENIDANTWQLTMREGVVFSNGEPVTAEAVKACLDRTYEVNPRAAETLPLESIEADGMTVTITTTNPVPSFENVICDPLFCIYYTADGIDYENEGTACTGPYVVTDFVFEDHVFLEPNPNYWDGTPKLDRVELYCYFDEDTQVMAMQNGELDALAMPGMSAYNTLVDGSNFITQAQASSRADFVRFNMEHPVVANDAVRLAVSYCIDRESYADVICAGTEVPSYGVYSSQLSYGGTDGLDVTVTGCDLEAAKAALDEAGVVDTDGDGVRELPDGTPCEINLFNCSLYERFVNLADDMQSKLAECGIKLNIHTVDYYLQDTETYNGDDPDMTIDSYGMAPTGDANYFASMCFATDGSANFGHYSNPEVDALIAKLATTFDQAERDQITKQISQLVLNDNAYIFYGNSQTSYITASYVTGLAIAPSEYYCVTKDTAVE